MAVLCPTKYIDIDLQPSKKEEVKKYIRSKYGFNQFCYIGTYTTLQLKAAIKDLSKLENVDYMTVNNISKKIDFDDAKSTYLDLFNSAFKNKELKKFINEHSNIVDDIKLVLGQPKSKSIHACATLIFPKEKEIYEWIPVRLEDKEGEQFLVSEWEGTELEKAGFLKEDILVIEQLDKYANIISTIKKQYNKDIDIFDMQLDEPKIYDFFQKGLTSDIFQFGTPIFKQYLKKLHPDNIEELIDAVALIRPGAMEVNSHNEYVLRKHGEREIEYKYGTEKITKSTKGLIITQEQVMQLCQSLGGFTLVEADDIRKAIGKKIVDLMQEQKIKFIDGAQKNGCSIDEAEDIWHDIEVHGSYSFNRSHSVGYTNVSYAGMYFKVYYPLAFWIASLTADKTNKFTAEYISEIYRTGNIKLLPPEINISGESFKPNFKDNCIYWSLSSIKQCGEKSVVQLFEEREQNGEYFSFNEFLIRNMRKGSKVTKQVIENLIYCGAFDEIERLYEPKQRLSLIDHYRDFGSIKIDSDKDILSIHRKDAEKYNWWWILQQKRLCGFAFFDFDNLCNCYLKSQYTYFDFTTILQEDSKNCKIKTGGYVNEVIERNSKKGKYCDIVLEQNYEFLTIRIWADDYKKLEKDLFDIEKKILLLTGKVNFDAYKQSNLLSVTKDNEIIILN